VIAQTLMLMALLAIFATSAVAGVAAVAREQNASAARALIVPGVETALGTYERYVAATIAAQAGAAAPNALAPPAAIPALNGTTPWTTQTTLETPVSSPLSVAVSVLPTAQTTPACATNGAGPDRAVELQCSAFVQESRLSLQITTDAGPADANGTVSPLAHGRFIVTLRLFAQPPYAIVSGAKDAAGPTDVHEGDDAGWGGALAAFASPSPDDTTIHVVYACTPGTGSCATSNPLPQDAPATIPWTDGNGPP
jgi:hypothetical protein